MRVVPGVDDLAAVTEPVERGQGQIQAPRADQLGHRPVEEGDQQAGDVGAVDVGVGHDDHPLIAQVLLAEPGSALDPQRQHEVRKLLVLAQLVGCGRGHVEDLPAQGQDGLRAPVPGLFGGAAGAVAFDDENLRPFRGGSRAVRELARQSQLPGRGGARDFLLATSLQALLGALDHEVEQGPRRLGLGGEPVVEGVAQSGLDQPLGLRRRQALLGLALELGVGDEDADQAARLCDHILCGQEAGALLAHEFRIGLESPGEGRAEAGLVRPAFGRGDGVAVGLEEAVSFAEACAGPGYGPLHLARIALPLEAAGEGLGGHRLQVLDPLCKVIRQAVGEPQDRFRRGLVVDERGIAGPADLDAAEQIGLGAGHAVKAGGPEGGGLAEDHRVWTEADGRAVLAGRTKLLKSPEGLAPAEGLPPLEAILEGGDFQVLGQGVHHGYADAMQAPGGLVGLAGEFPAGMQDGHDDLQRRLPRMLRVGVDRNAAPVVPDGQASVRPEPHLDEPRMPGHGFVHGVIQHLGEEVMEGPFICPADVHAGAHADRLQPLEDLDVLGGVPALRWRRGRGRRGGRSFGLRRRCGRSRSGLRIVEERGLWGRFSHAFPLPRFGPGIRKAAGIPAAFP